jgi:hypothetical protein
MKDEDQKYEKILEDKSLKDAIRRCGELQVPFEEVILLLAGRDINTKEIFKNLSTPGTDEYLWYQEGAAEGNLQLKINLECNVGDSKAKDAYKNLYAERRTEVINRAIKDKFGIG